MAWRKGAVFLILVLALAAIPGVVPVKTIDCLLKLKGEYSGTISVTRSGYKCQRWDALCPRSHTSQFTDADFVDGSKTAASNYCRNPKSDLQIYPWCYIADPKSPLDFELCHIPFCTKGTECTFSASGAEYLGTHSVATASNGKQHTCQRWDSQTPNKHSRKAGGVHLNEDTLTEAENYCRNIKGTEPKPWCYTTGGPRWEYCDINPQICQTAKICSDPPTVENAIRLTPTAAGPYDYRATATYKCSTGYEFADENDGVECLLTKKWSAKPICVKVKCPTLELDTPASLVVNGDPDTYDTTVTYNCDEGSKHTGGDLTIKCQSDKTWSGTAPTCMQIDCGTAPTVSEATLELMTSTLLGGVARYRCDKDNVTYEKICKEDGYWVGTICSDNVSQEATTTGVLSSVTVAVECSTEDLLKNPAVLAGLIICSVIAFSTVLGLSIAICKLKQTAAAASEINAKTTPRAQLGNRYKLEQPPAHADRKLTAARMEQYGNHYYYRDLY
ncbi:apolipoprotein(a)-like isoform X2 [Lineus longissimus]